MRSIYDIVIHVIDFINVHLFCYHKNKYDNILINRFLKGGGSE